MLRSKCIDCTFCKIIFPHTDPLSVRCSEEVGFKGVLAIDHPFITLERTCASFDAEYDEEVSTNGTIGMG